MPVLIPGSKVGSDNLKVKFLMIFGRPKIGFFGTFPGPRGTFPQFPLATNHAEWGRWAAAGALPWAPLGAATGKPELHGSE